MRPILLTIGMLAMGTTVWAQAPQQTQPEPGNSGVANSQQPGTQQPRTQQSGAQPNAQQPNVQVGVGVAAGAQQPNAAQPSGRTRFHRVPAAQPPHPDYSLYGGTSTQYESPPTRGVRNEQLGPLYKLYGVPDEIERLDREREQRRDTAVEFGVFRHQFAGSTQFWMDFDRSRLAKARYAMDEGLWRAIHPAYEFGDGGYLYNTATVPSSYPDNLPSPVISNQSSSSAQGALSGSAGASNASSAP